MKRFKKVLALVLAGVLALAMLTACDGGTTDPDKVIPDIDTANVVDTVNHMAADSKEGLGQVYYSAKYSEITKELLNNWLENREKSVTYAEEYQKIVAKMGGNAKIVVGLTDKNVIPGLTSGNPAVKGSAKYDVLFKDTSAYNLADRIGVAFVKTENGTAGLPVRRELSITQRQNSITHKKPPEAARTAFRGLLCQRNCLLLVLVDLNIVGGVSVLHKEKRAGECGG